MVARNKMINRIIADKGYQSYLEIGIADGRNFSLINVKTKDGVDPNYPCNNRVTSDQFFANLSATKLYDFIFIDGLHTKEQVAKDISNSLNHLALNGTIMVHDLSPRTPEEATPKQTTTGSWFGNGYECWLSLRMTRSDLEMCVISTDSGCGIIRRGTQQLYPKKDISWCIMVEDRKNALNLVSIEEFFGGKL
jgi:hypothetical protein